MDVLDALVRRLLQGQGELADNAGQAVAKMHDDLELLPLLRVVLVMSGACNFIVGR